MEMNTSMSQSPPIQAEQAQRVPIRYPKGKAEKQVDATNGYSK
jgi:hypothetical protein